MWGGDERKSVWGNIEEINGLIGEETELKQKKKDLFMAKMKWAGGRGVEEQSTGKTKQENKTRAELIQAE